MKNVLCILLAAVLSVVFSACALVSRTAADAPAAERKKFTASPLNTPGAAVSSGEGEVSPDLSGADSAVLSLEEQKGDSAEEVFDMPEETDPLYADAQAMFLAVSPLFDYFAFSGREPDLDNLSADDFWLLMAMSAANTATEEQIDEDGNIIFDWNGISDYASCLLGSYFAANGINTYDDSYSAYADPRGLTISLSSMAVSGFRTDLLGFWEDTENPGYYIMLVQTDHDHYAEGDTADYRMRWEVILQGHEDGSEHVLPFDLRGFNSVPVDTGAQ